VLPERLVWIGGSTASGKTSIAGYLAEKYGLEPYHVDRFDEEHVARRDAVAQPALEAWAGRTLDETWVELPVEELVEATLDFHRERFPFILDDVARLSSAVVVEGFALLPELVAPQLADPRQAVFLVSTERFRLEALQRRRTASTMPRRTSNPARALQNRLDRDEQLAEHIRCDARVRGLSVVEVDGKRPLSVVAADVEARLFPFL
jgi:adenylate kinase family enzyme